MKKNQKPTLTHHTKKLEPPTTAPVSEIFVSYQGEGARVGEPQIFVRLSGCNLMCDYCDTPYAISRTHSKLMSVKTVFQKIKATLKKSPLRPETISITGGEPLLYPEFVYILSSELKKHQYQILLETNATLPNNINSKIIKNIDLVSADIKLPSSLPSRKPADLKSRQSAFLKKIPPSKLYIKIPVTSRTTPKEFTDAMHLIKKNTTSSSPVFIQPITPPTKNKKSPDTPSPETIFRMNLIARKILGEQRKIHILPQLHKLLWKVR